MLAHCPEAGLLLLVPRMIDHGLQAVLRLVVACLLAFAVLANPRVSKANEPRLAAVLSALDDPDAAVKLRTLQWLKDYGVHSGAVVEGWAPVLAQSPGLVQLQEQLLNDDQNQQELYAALRSMPALVAWLEPGVLRAAREAPMTVQLLAIPLLAGLTRPSKATLDALVQLLDAKDENVQGVAEKACLALGSHYAALPGIATELLRRESTRARALTMLAQGWPAPIETPSVLADFISSPNASFVKLAIDALQRRPQGIPVWDELSAQSKAASLPLCGLGPFVAPPDVLKALLDRCSVGPPDATEVMLKALALKTDPAADTFEVVRRGIGSESKAVRLAAFGVLSAWPDVAALPMLTAALTDSDSSIICAALDGIGRLGATGKSTLPKVLWALQSNADVEEKALGGVLQAISPEGHELPDALSSLLACPRPSGEKCTDDTVHIRLRNAILANATLRARMHSVIVPLLQRGNRATVRETAVALAEGQALTHDQTQGLVEVLRSAASEEAIDVFGGQHAAVKDYVQELSRFLNAEGGLRLHALKAISSIGMSDPTVEQQLVALARHPDTLVREAALRAIGVAPSAPTLIEQNFALFEDALRSESAPAAIEALAYRPEVGRKHSALIVSKLKGDDHQAAHIVAARALAKLAPLGDAAVLEILEFACTNKDESARYRLFALLAAGGRSESVELTRMLCNGKRDALPPSLEGRRAFLKRVKGLWGYTNSLPLVRTEVGNRVDEIVQAEPFQVADLELIEDVRALLEQAKHPAAERMARTMYPLKVLRYGGTFAQIIGLHALAWIVLLIAYPHSRMLRAFIFWHPWARKIAGLGYMELVLCHVSFVRTRLLAPFKDRLVEDALIDPDDVPQGGYFEGSLVEYAFPGHGNETRKIALKEAIASVQGAVTLEGESGLGKSVALRRLVRLATRPTIYLAAERCAGGVVAAIQQKFLGFVKDEAFLETIIYTGGLDVCIDGLNEVTPDTRATITEFVRSHPGTTVLLATQPLLDWRAPGRVYRLLPLQEAHAIEFLKSRYDATDERRTLSRVDYELTCDDYIAEALEPNQDGELLMSLRRVLSNPMDLTVVAQMLLARTRPDLLRLQEQQFAVAASRFSRATLREFPLAQFSERIYQMRLRDDSELPSDISEEETTALALAKMIFGRNGREGQRRWYFRHDKVLEFFVLQTFLADGGRRAEQHIEDPRFRGVYLLLAMRLPLEAALLLRDQLVLRAAKTNDHITCDRFVQLLESRKLAKDGGPVWLAAYELPEERAARRTLAERQRAHDLAGRDLETARLAAERSFNSRSMLIEFSEEQLLARAVRVVRELGATAVARDAETHEGGPAYAFQADGKQFVLVAATSGEALLESDIHDALRVAEGGAFEAMPVLVVNVSASIDPVRRAPWLTPGAEALLSERGAIGITTLALLRAVAAVQSGQQSRTEFWLSLPSTGGLWDSTREAGVS